MYFFFVIYVPVRLYMTSRANHSSVPARAKLRYFWQTEKEGKKTFRKLTGTIYAFLYCLCLWGSKHHTTITRQKLLSNRKQKKLTCPIKKKHVLLIIPVDISALSTRHLQTTNNTSLTEFSRDKFVAALPCSSTLLARSETSYNVRCFPKEKPAEVPNTARGQDRIMIIY